MTFGRELAVPDKSLQQKNTLSSNNIASAQRAIHGPDTRTLHPIHCPSLDISVTETYASFIHSRKMHWYRNCCNPCDTAINKKKTKAKFLQNLCSHIQISLFWCDGKLALSCLFNCTSHLCTTQPKPHTSAPLPRTPWVTVSFKAGTFSISVNSWVSQVCKVLVSL